MSDSRPLTFGRVLLLELGLLAALGIAATFLGGALFRSLQWDAMGFGAGMVGALPLGVLLLWVRTSRCGAVRQIRAFVEVTLRPVFRGTRWPQWLVLAMLAGFGEEALFRGGLQTFLSAEVGTVAGWATTALVFGFCHAVNRSYFLLATMVGAWLGAIYAFTGNWLGPALAHAAYDFAALAWIAAPDPTGTASVLDGNDRIGTVPSDSIAMRNCQPRNHSAK